MPNKRLQARRLLIFKADLCLRQFNNLAGCAQSVDTNNCLMRSEQTRWLFGLTIIRSKLSLRKQLQRKNNLGKWINAIIKQAQRSKLFTQDFVNTTDTIKSCCKNPLVILNNNRKGLMVKCYQLSGNRRSQVASTINQIYLFS